MSELAQIRDSAPWAKDLSDEELIGKLSELSGDSIRTVAKNVGFKFNEKRNPLSAGISSGIDDLQGLGYSGVAALGDLVGSKSLKAWGERGADRNKVESELNGRPDLNRVEDQTWGSALPFVGYQVAKQIPNITGAIAAGLITPQVAIPAGLARAGAFVPRMLGGGGLNTARAAGGIDEVAAAANAGKTLARQLTGGAAFNYGTGVGAVYDSARENTEDASPGATAFLGGVPHALAETVPQAMLFGKLAHGSGASGNLLTRMGKNFLVQGGAGATSELTQGEIEMAVGKPLSAEEKFSQRLNAGVVGGVVEGIFGLPGGISRGRTTSPGAGSTDGSGISTAINGDNSTNLSGFDPQQLAMRQRQLELERNATQTQADASQQAADQTAAANAAQVKQQQEDDKKKAFATLATAFGIKPVTAEDGSQTGEFTIGGRPLFTQQDAMTYMSELEEASKNIPPEKKQLIGAMINAGLVQVGASDGAKGVIARVNSAIKKYQFDTATDADEVTRRIDKTIDAIPAEDDVRGNSKNARLAHEMNKLHLNLTGMPAPALARAEARNDAFQKQEADAKAAQDALKQKKTSGSQKTTGGTKAATTTAAAPVTQGNAQAVAEAQARLDAENNSQGAVNGQQLQTTPGVGAVSEQTSPTKTSGANTGDVRSSNVQSVESGGQSVGSDAVQNAAGRDGGNGQRTVQSTDANGSGSGNAQAQEVKATLPSNLAGAKPRYAYGGNQFELKFDNDIDKAAYITAQATPSRFDKDYLKFVMDATGMTEAEVRRHGALVKASIKETSKNAETGGTITVPSLARFAPRDSNGPAQDTLAASATDDEKRTDSVQGNAASESPEVLPTRSSEGSSQPTANTQEGDVNGQTAAGVSATSAGDTGAQSNRTTGGGSNARDDSAVSKKDSGRDGSTGSESPGQIAAIQEGTRTRLGQVFKAVFAIAHPKEKNRDKKVKFYSAYYGVPVSERDKTVTQLAEEFDVSRSTLARWSTGLETFLQDYAHVMPEALAQVANTEGVSTLDLTRELAEAQFVRETIREAEADTTDERTEVEREVFDADQERYKDAVIKDMVGSAATEESGETTGDVVIRQNSMGESVSDQTGIGEGASTAYDKWATKQEELQAALQLAEDEAGDVEKAQKDLDDHDAKLPAILKAAEKAHKKGVRTNVSGKDTTDDTAETKTKKDSGKSTKKDTKTGGKKAATTEAEKPAAAQTAVETSLERAKRKWNNFANATGTKQFDDLTEKQQKDFAAFDEKDQTPKDVERFMLDNGLAPQVETSTSASPRKYTSRRAQGEKTETAKSLAQAIFKFIRIRNPEILKIVDTYDDLPDDIKNAVPDSVRTAGGFVLNGEQVYLIAENILVGRGPAVFLHELGGHRGLQQVMDSKDWDALLDVLNDWATRNDGSIESQIAIRALERVKNADTDVAAVNNEWVAYAIEEAMLQGISPTATKSASPIGRWVKKVYDLFRNTLAMLGVAPNSFSAQDLVDMAFAAARYTMEGRNTDGSTNADTPPVQMSKAMSRIKQNVSTLPAQAQPFATALSGLLQRAIIGTSFTRDLVSRAVKVGMKSAQAYIDGMGEQVAIRNEERRMVEHIAGQAEKLSPQEREAVNGLLKDSTMQKKWAYAPDYLDFGKPEDKKTKVDEALAKRFNALSADGQQVVRNVFAHGYANIKKIQGLLTTTMIEEYDAGIARAVAAGDEKEAKRLRQDKAFELKDKTKLLEERGDKPYAPLGRFGDHVVTMRSEEMQINQKILNERESGNYSDDEIKAAKKFIEEFRDDPEHLQVHFAENSVQAAKLEEKLKALGRTQSFKRNEAASKFGGPQIQGLMYRARNLLNNEEDDSLSGNRRSLNNLLTNLHLNLLHEQSSRHSEHKRLNIEGADDNMMRSFYQHGIGNASFVAGLHKSKEIYDALDRMKKEAEDITSGNRAERQAVHDEIVARYAIGLERNENELVNTALRANSAFMLLTKPTYFLQQLVQPGMMSLPVLAGRFQGRAISAMVNAYKDVSGTMTRNTLTPEIINKLPKDVRQAVQDLMARGHLNIDLDQDMGDRLKGTGPLSSVVRRLQNMAERIEGINRVVTAVAAYRLAINTDGHEKAVAYAAKIVHDTHGDYSGMNAPRYMRNSFGRVITQFRKIQLIQVSLLAKLGQQAFYGASRDEKLVGRYALGYTLGTTFAFGGLMALPAYQSIAWIIGRIMGMVGDDEPEDPVAQEARMRRLIGEPGLADFLLKGVPKALGTDMQNVFGGYGGMLSLLPYTKIEDMSRSTAQNIIVGAMGPVASTGVKMFAGLGDIADGKYVKGVSALLPTGIGNVVQAFDKQANGLTRPNGAAILKPEEIGVFDTALAAVGLRTNTIGDREFINRVQTTYEAYFRDETRSIEQKYIRAYTEGNSDAMQKARETWQSLNEKRREYGFKPQPLSDLFKAPANARKYEMRTQRALDRSGSRLAGFAE